MKKEIISEERLLEILPSGSGIDCDWNIIIHDNGNVTAKNEFHAMNEAGFYDGYMPFTVKIFRHTKDVLNELKGPSVGKTQVISRIGDVDFKLFCNENARASFYGLKEYLNDTINYHLDIAGILTNRNEVVNG